MWGRSGRLYHHRAGRGRYAAQAVRTSIRSRSIWPGPRVAQLADLDCQAVSASADGCRQSGHCFVDPFDAAFVALAVQSLIPSRRSPRYSGPPWRCTACSTGRARGAHVEAEGAEEVELADPGGSWQPLEQLATLAIDESAVADEQQRSVGGHHEVCRQPVEGSAERHKDRCHEQLDGQISQQHDDEEGQQRPRGGRRVRAEAFDDLLYLLAGLQDRGDFLSPRAGNTAAAGKLLGQWHGPSPSARAPSVP